MGRCPFTVTLFSLKSHALGITQTMTRKLKLVNTKNLHYHRQYITRCNKYLVIGAGNRYEFNDGLSKAKTK